MVGVSARKAGAAREKCGFHPAYVLRPTSSNFVIGIDFADIKLCRFVTASVFESLSFLCEFPARCLFWFQPNDCKSSRPEQIHSSLLLCVLRCLAGFNYSLQNRVW